MTQHALGWKVSHHCGCLSVAFRFRCQIQTWHPRIGNFLPTEAWKEAQGYPVPAQQLTTSSGQTKMCGCHYYVAEIHPTSDLSFGFRRGAKSFLQISTWDTVCMSFNNICCTVVLFWDYRCCICVHGDESCEIPQRVIWSRYYCVTHLTLDASKPNFHFGVPITHTMAWCLKGQFCVQYVCVYMCVLLVWWLRWNKRS